MVRNDVRPAMDAEHLRACAGARSALLFPAAIPFLCVLSNEGRRKPYISHLAAYNAVRSHRSDGRLVSPCVYSRLPGMSGCVNGRSRPKTGKHGDHRGARRSGVSTVRPRRRASSRGGSPQWQRYNLPADLPAPWRMRAESGRAPAKAGGTTPAPQRRVNRNRMRIMAQTAARLATIG